MNDNPWGGYDDLDQFGNEANPEAAFRPTLETLANGEYDFEIVDAVLTHVNQKRVCRVGLKILSLNRVVEHTYWIGTLHGMNGFLAELKTLQFDAHRWGSREGQIPLSTVLPEVMTKLPGLKIHAVKTSNTGSDGKVYPRLSITGRLSGAPMPPSSPKSNGGKQTSTSPSKPKQQSQPNFDNDAPSSNSSDLADIPF